MLGLKVWVTMSGSTRGSYLFLLVCLLCLCAHSCPCHWRSGGQGMTCGVSSFLPPWVVRHGSTCLYLQSHLVTPKGVLLFCFLFFSCFWERFSCSPGWLHTFCVEGFHLSAGIYRCLPQHPLPESFSGGKNDPNSSWYVLCGLDTLLPKPNRYTKKTAN